LTNLGNNILQNNEEKIYLIVGIKNRKIFRRNFNVIKHFRKL